MARVRLLIAAAAFVVSVHAVASEESVQARWISPLGKPVNLGWPTATAWVWKDLQQGKHKRHRPYLRTWIGLPKNVRLLSADTDEAQLLKDPPTPPTGDADSWIAFDTRENSISGTLKFEDHRANVTKEQRIGEMGLLITRRSQRAELALHDSCGELGIHLKPLKSKPNVGTSFLGVACHKTRGETLEFDFFSNPDADIKLSVLTKEEIEPGWVRGIYDRRKETSKPSEKASEKTTERPEAILVKVSTAAGAAYYQIALENRELNRWTFYTGLGFTYFTYKDFQTAETVTLSATALSLKAGVNYAFTRRFDASLSGYGNIVNLTSSITPADYPVARFAGINLRGGWTAISKPDFALKLSTGWYYWAMMVDQAAYGIARVMGPQIFISTLFSVAKDRKMSAYMKYAPIGSGLGNFSFSSYEVAGGVSYPLNGSRSKYQWSLTLDASTLSISESMSITKPSLTTFSLGTQVGF